jgi:FlaA1/EpsC-like NDP-sugar epimerase
MSQLLFVLLLLIFAVSPIEATTKKITRVLVLGGTGRVGSAVVSKLLSQGIETRVLARNKAAASKNVRFPCIRRYIVVTIQFNPIQLLTQRCYNG